MKNKRRAPRQDCLVPVDGKQGSVFSGIQTVDFSKGGLGLISSKKIPVNKEIAVELDLNADEEPVLAIGRVQWVRKVRGEDFYRLGMIFKDVLRGSKSRLEQYFKVS